MNEQTALLEASDGSRTAVASPFTIGRASSATLVIDDEKASRIHAQLHSDPESGGWWVTDLQSTNGTYVNGVRIRQATRLNSGDRLHICNKAWIFRASLPPNTANRSRPGIRTTATSVAATDCWLMLADVVGSTPLLEVCGAQEYASRLRQWMADLDTLVRATSGFVNERLGDGLLAVWDARHARAEQIADVFHQLETLCPRHSTPFRALIHFGEILVGGNGYSSGLESLTGPALNHLFKSERALPNRSPGLFLSETAQRQHSSRITVEPVGQVHIPGFAPENYYRVTGTGPETSAAESSNSGPLHQL